MRTAEQAGRGGTNKATQNPGPAACTTCSEMRCQSMQVDDCCCGVSTRLRQPCVGQPSGGVYRPSGKAARVASPHLPQTNSISVTTGVGAVARTTVPHTLTSLPMASALICWTGRRAAARTRAGKHAEVDAV